MAFPVPTFSTANTGFSSPMPALAAPTGLAVGDLMIMALTAVSVGNFNASVSPPSGWTTLASYNNGSNQYVYGCYWKIATSADIASFPLSGLASGARCCSAIYRVTGADSTNPILASSTSNGSGTTQTAASISPNQQCLFLLIGMLGQSANGYTPGFTSTSIANSNPSWTGDINIGTSDTGDYAALSSAHANETGAPGSATGTATVVSSGFSANAATLVFIAVQPPVYVSDFFGSTFAFFQPIIPVIITEFLSATFGVFQATAVDIPNLWNNTVKSVLSVFNNTTKS